MFDAKRLESAEFYRRRTANFATLIIFPILGILFLLLIFSLFAKKELTVKSIASIEPTKIIQQMQSTSSGNILENNLKEGLLVTNGQLLVRYDTSSDATQQSDLQSQLHQAQDQKTQLTFLQSSLNTDNNQFPSPDPYGDYQTFVDYQAQMAVITDNINKSNQAVNDQNISTENGQSAIQAQVNQMTLQLSNLNSLKTDVSSGMKPNASNPYYAQYTDYQSQLSNFNSQIQTLQAQYQTTIQGDIDQLQSQINTLNTQISQLSPMDSTMSEDLNQLTTLRQELQDYSAVKNASSSSAISASNPFKAQYDALQSQIASLRSQASGLQSQLVSSLQSQIDTLQNQLDTLKTQSAGLTTSKSIDNSLSGQLSALKAESLLKVNQEMTSLSANITDLQTKLKLLAQDSQGGTLTTSSAGVLHVLPGVLGVKKISVGTPIAEIYPAFTANSVIRISAYLPAGQISAVSVGQTMRFQV